MLKLGEHYPAEQNQRRIKKEKKKKKDKVNLPDITHQKQDGPE